MAKVFLFPEGMSFNMSWKMLCYNPFFHDCPFPRFQAYCKNSKEFAEFFGRPRDAAIWRYWYQIQIQKPYKYLNKFIRL